MYIVKMYSVIILIEEKRILAQILHVHVAALKQFCNTGKTLILTKCSQTYMYLKHFSSAVHTL